MTIRSAIPRYAATLGANYRPALDGYRGLFVVLVVAYHFGLTWLAGGWIGINHFFVFSGYLIGRLLLKERYRTGTIWAGRFYLRRMRRVVPAMAVLVAAVLVHTVLATDGPRRQTAGDAFATLTFWLNWRLIGRNDQYFDLFDEPSPLRHAWTLSVEEQFYLVAPWLVLLLFVLFRRRMTRFWVVAGLAVISAVWSAHLITQPDVTSSRIYYGTDVRVQAILVGLATAVLFTWKRPGRAVRLSAGVTSILGWTGTIVSIGAFFVIGDDPTGLFTHGGVLLFAIAAAVMGISATDARDLSINRIFGWRPLVFLGRISYGIYLYHWPITLWLPLDGLPLAFSFAVKLGLTVAVAAVSYRYLELPVLVGGFSSLVPWRAIRRYSGMTLVAGLCALALALAAGLNDPATAAYKGPALDPQLHYTAPTGALAPLKVAMVGDSIPASLQEGFQAADYPGMDLLRLARIEGCDAIPVTLDVGGHLQQDAPSCAAWRAQWPAQAKAARTQVLVAPAGLRFILPLRVNGTAEPMGSPASQRVLGDNLDALLRQYEQSGASRLVLVNVPCRLLTPQTLAGAYRRVLGQAPRPIDPAWANRLIADWASRHRAEGVRVLDLNAQLCPDGYRASINGTQIYKDGVHFTPAGAQLVWTWLAPELVAAATTGGAA